ncbi:OprD family outer membrane porin [Spartinivicinus ruber]|uniref:OprD family outer membrane porin n=1 Tax=Spartinivicinus ruber TaxID=2683272 RepID=UPI0013D8C743|nr:OprD family outer membrane porin [Spartinivicinus ruber]
MKTFKFSTLAAAVVAASAASITTAQAEGFIEDSTGNLSIRNYYFNENGKNGNDFDRREWVQGFRFDFVSGYLFDTIGFDYSAGAAFKLDAPGKNFTNLPKDKGSNNDVNDIGGTTQAYVKAKFGDENLGLNAKHGLMQLGTATFGTSGSRILPSSVFATYLEGNVSGLKLYGARITKHSDRDSSNFADALQSNGVNDNVDYVNIVGAAYEFENGLGFEVEAGKSDDFVEKRFAKAYYTIDMGSDTSLLLDARYGEAEEDGNKYDDTPNDRAESRYYNATATLNVGAASTWVGYNRTYEGNWISEYYGQDYGTFNSSLSLWQDYSRKDEKAWVVGVGYDFSDAGIPGLTAKAWYARSNGIDTVDAQVAHEGGSEFTQDLTYKFQTGALKDLSVQWQHTRLNSPKADNDEDSHRIKLIYDIALF